MSFELLKPNYIDTTTGFTVQSNTQTASYLFDRDPSFQYVSSGYADDLTQTTIRINFAETLTVDRIALLGINLKAFDVYYNGVTANTFALTSTGATTVSSFTTNSETSMFLRCTPVSCTSVSFDLKKTISANAEKALGFVYAGQKRFEFDRDPSASDYKPNFQSIEVVHKTSDGGTRIQTVADKWSVDLKLDHVQTSFRNSLRDAFKLHESHVFVPFGTTTSWDQVIFPCVWQGPFDFYKYTDNAPDAGFTGSLRLRETPR